MRVGNNPNKSALANSYMPVVLSVVTYLPNQIGYHAKRFEVIQKCLRSMTQHAEMDFTLIIWDNGSIPELLDWMRDEIKPDILIRSENMGKTTAKRSVAGMIPPESIISFCDDDIYFYPNWLKPQIETLGHFPNTAIVTGYPVRTAFRWGTENTLKNCRNFGRVSEGRFIPRQWEDDFALSVGRTPEFQADYTKYDIDYKVEYKGREAFCTSHHCQFVSKAKNVVKATAFDGQALGEEKTFDIEMDKLGLRLATTQRLTRHIGNILDDKLKDEIGA